MSTRVKSMFTGLNQRMHRLWPSNESFTGEIERSLINIGMAGQTPGGVRYFARLHGVKDPPTVSGHPGSSACPCDTYTCPAHLTRSLSAHAARGKA